MMKDDESKQVTMREHKYRFWDRVDKVMIYDLRITRTDSAINDLFRMDRYEPLEYTGFKDSQGQDIYEGDIIEFVREQWYPEGPLKKYRKALDQSTLLEVLSQADAIHDGVIVGNTYENPELLKVSSNE